MLRTYRRLRDCDPQEDSMLLDAFWSKGLSFCFLTVWM